LSVIWNVVDHRQRRYRWKRIDAVIEPTWQDNCCADSDQAEKIASLDPCEARKGVSVAEAIAWANGKAHAVTLYLYDAEGA
jgi:hypothetical protein